MAFVFLLSAIKLLFYRLSDFIPSVVPIKDSAFFINKYLFFIEKGWYESIVAGASPVFNSVVWVIDLFMNNPYQSMKLLSMISTVGIVLTWIYFVVAVLKISKKYIFIAIAFSLYLSVLLGSFFSGTNDALFCLFISLGIVSLFNFVKSSSQVAFCCSSFYFCLALGTREIFIFYAPGLLVILMLLLISKKTELLNGLTYIGIFLLGTLVIYFPSLVENQALKFADKNQAGRNWPEKNYLQVYLNVPQMTFEEVRLFKENNPDILLPQTYSEAIFLNPKMTVSNFFRQLTLTQKPFVWQIGILFLLFLTVAIMKIWQMNWVDLNVLSLFLYGLFALAFSILLINRVEFRWFMVFPYLFTGLGIQSLERYAGKYPVLEWLFWVNCMIISCLNFNLIGVWK